MPPALTRTSWVVFLPSIHEELGSPCGQPCLGVAMAWAALGGLQLSGPRVSSKDRAVLWLRVGIMGLQLPADCLGPAPNAGSSVNEHLPGAIPRLLACHR